MADAKDSTKTLSKEEAAKRVKRQVSTVVDDKPQTKAVPVSPKEVLDFKDYGSHVVVITTDGQKLTDLVA